MVTVVHAVEISSQHDTTAHTMLQVEAAKVEATGAGLSANKAAGRSAEEMKRLEDRLGQSQVSCINDVVCS
jgi:hypothetical protein